MNKDITSFFKDKKAVVKTIGVALMLSCLYYYPSSTLKAKSPTEANPAYKPISTYNSLNGDKSRTNPRMQSMQSRMALKNNDLARAIQFGKSAVENDPEDLDARVAYGEALYKRVQEIGLDDIDTTTYNNCVMTWLVVYRNVAGEESSSIKGISIPGGDRFFADEDRSQLAKSRIKDLCGRTPKFWESNKKFLKKVLRSKSSVQGQVVKKKNIRTEDR